MSSQEYPLEYSIIEQASIVAEEREEYLVPSKWFSQIPVYVFLDPDLTHADLVVYAALDFLCGKRGYWHVDQNNIFDSIRDQLIGEIPILMDLSNKSIRRAVDKLRQKDYIRTEQMGLKMNHILEYYVMFRKPVDPPKRSKKK